MGAARTIRTFSIDRGLLKEVERTKGSESTSERVNRLLKAGLEAERRESLDKEAKAFFKSHKDTKSRRAFQSASLKSLTRE